MVVVDQGTAKRPPVTQIEEQAGGEGIMGE